MRLDTIYRELGKLYGLPARDVEQVCNSQFRFIKDKIVEADKKDILVRYLFRFKIKQKYEIDRRKS